MQICLPDTKIWDPPERQGSFRHPTPWIRFSSPFWRPPWIRENTEGESERQDTISGQNQFDRLGGLRKCQQIRCPRHTGVENGRIPKVMGRKNGGVPVFFLVGCCCCFLAFLWRMNGWWSESVALCCIVTDNFCVLGRVSIDSRLQKRRTKRCSRRGPASTDSQGMSWS